MWQPGFYRMQIKFQKLNTKANHKNPNKFNFEVEGKSLRFPQSKNTLTLVQMEKDLKMILDSAKIKCNIEKVPSK
jgi:3-methyladenine DNA glycosylase AlkC